MHEYADNMGMPHKTCLPLAIKTRLLDHILGAYYTSVTTAGSTSAVVGVYWSRGKCSISFLYFDTLAAFSPLWDRALYQILYRRRAKCTQTLINPYTVPHHQQAGDLPSDAP